MKNTNTAKQGLPIIIKGLLFAVIGLAVALSHAPIIEIGGWVLAIYGVAKIIFGTYYIIAVKKGA